MTTPEALFASIMASSPAQPLITYYDEKTGERSELSARSLANWVAKTHYLLIDELGLGVGDSAYVALPPHWISLPVLLGCWSAGLDVHSSPAGAAVAFVSPETLSTAAGIPDVYAIAPESAAVGFRLTPPAGSDDYVAAVRPQPDAWAGVHRAAGDDDPGLDGTARGEVVAAALARAGQLGISAGGRVLTGRDWTGPADWIDTVLAPLSQGASLVYVRHGDDTILARRRDQERATVIV
jgi:uncharacterized protein (TIGR03089 family)